MKIKIAWKNFHLKRLMFDPLTIKITLQPSGVFYYWNQLTDKSIVDEVIYD